MQRNQFNVTVANADTVDYVKRTTFPRVNTFSDCIRDAAYTTLNKQVIHVRNEEFDLLEDLI